MEIELALDRIAWPEVEEYLRKDDRLLIVIGSCEQHGRHLPFTVDVMVPWEIATRAAKKTGVLIAPPITYGMSLHHMAFPGTLSLRPETLVLLLKDVVLCAYRAGFRRITIVNGHGGNRASLNSSAICSLFELTDLKVKIIHWWEDPDLQALIRELFDGMEHHATAVETSCMLVIDASRVRMEAARFSVPRQGPLVIGTQQWRQFYPHGSAGIDPRLANREAGERILNMAVEQLSKHLNEW